MFGVCKSMFTVNLTNKKGKQLWKNITIHRGLAAFNFYFPKNREVFMFMMFGLTGIAGKP